MNIRKDKGITLVALVVTIVVLLIIAGISISGTMKGIDETEESTQVSALKIVQHAILERYTKSLYTKETLPGEIVDEDEVRAIIEEINQETNSNISLKGTEYKRLSKQDLYNLGIEKEESSYIVNYKTGEVINETIKVTKSKRALYIFAKED